MTSKRTISAANETALLAQVKKLVYFVRMDFSAGVERFHTEIGPKTATHPIHGAEVYQGIGDFGGLQGDVVESVSGAPQAIKLSLSGVKASLVTSAVVDDYYRRDVEVMLGLEDEAGDLIDDPEILFSGFMDKMDISLNRNVGTMVLTCESRGTNLLRASDHRFTDEDKQAEVSGDLLGEYIYRMMDLELFWGNAQSPLVFPYYPNFDPANPWGPGPNFGGLGTPDD